MLKSVHPILFLVLISSSCIASARCAEAAPCMPKHKFMTDLDKAVPGIVFAAVTPYQNETTCGGLWKKFGTCCEVKKLEEYARSDRKNITDAINELVSIIKKLADEYFIIKKLGSTFKKMTGGPIRDLIDFISSPQMAQFNQIMRIFKNPKVFKQQLHQCYDYTWEIRSSSLCSMCLGVSEVFFKNNKALIFKNECTVILDKCKPVFNIAFNFFDQVLPLLDCILKVEKEGHALDIIIKRLLKVIVTLREVALKIKSTNIVRLMSDFHVAGQKDTAESITDSQGAKSLCEHLVRLHDQPLVVFIAELVKEIEGELNKVSKLLIGAGLQNAFHTTISNFNPFKRMMKRKLQAGFPGDSSINSSNFLIGDVQVASKVDSSYASFFGSTGSTNIIIHPHGYPMNLTNKFP